MFDQAEYLFNNRYYPEVIDKVFHKVQETSWDHCVNIQRAMCDHKILSGRLTEFTLDDERNRKQGFPKGSYALFIHERLLYGHQKYILQHFLKNKELLTIREMLDNENFEHQFIFHLADFIFMNLLCRVVQNGTWLVIPVDTPDGVSKDKLMQMMRDYDNPWTPSLWMLEIRPRVSYAYGSTLTSTLIDANNRIYLDASYLSEWNHYIRMDEMVEWKVCVTENEDEVNLLRVTTGIWNYDEERQAGYIEVSQSFANFIKGATFTTKVFLYNEGRKVGYAISPNYIGPSVYLKTVFDEYIAAENASRFKVLAKSIEGGWTYLGGWDDHFDPNDPELITVGFTLDQCWIALPTKDGVCPIWPGNFRVWEYDYTTDTLGRLVATNTEAVWPNIYTYKMSSDSELLFIEWFRDDILKGTNYDDFSKGYRDYVGPEFYINKIDGKIIPTLQNYQPLHTVYDTIDLIPRLLLYGSNDYRRIKIEELLNETGLHWKDFQEALDDKNKKYVTLTYRLAEMPTLYENLKNEVGCNPGRGRIPISTTYDVLRTYDLYIDGVHINETTTHWENFYQYIYLPSALVNPDSIIIIDMYDKDFQYTSVEMVMGTIPGENNLPDDFPMPYVSGNDLIITKQDGTRIPRDEFEYTLHCVELLAQVPNKMIKWDELGIDPEDIELKRRGRAVEWEDPFRSTVFRFIMTDDRAYAYLKTVFDNQLMSSDPSQRLMVRNSNIIVHHSPDFSKRVKANNLGINFLAEDKVQRGLTRKKEPTIIKIWNSNVRTSAINKDLSAVPYVQINGFCGSDDPDRILPFINGRLCYRDEVNGAIPEKMCDPFMVFYVNPQTPGTIGEIVYLPFRVDQFELTSNAKGYLDLSTTPVDVIGSRDMIFEDGFRIPNDDVIRVTNVRVKVPKPNTRYTIIRQHRDPEMYNFNRSSLQSIMDKVFVESPGYWNSVDAALQN